MLEMWYEIISNQKLQGLKFDVSSAKRRIFERKSSFDGVIQNSFLRKSCPDSQRIAETAKLI